MRPQERAAARRQIDKRLKSLSDSTALSAPPRGWIKAIREALGMTTAQMARRLGVSQPRVVAIEQAEAKGSITLETLERAAHALDCRVVYALVPQKPLEATVEDQAHRVARKRLQSTSHTMALEAQSVEKQDQAAQIERLSRQLQERSSSSLWDDDE